jgi:hypothetical protein
MSFVGAQATPASRYLTANGSTLGANAGLERAKIPQPHPECPNPACETSFNAVTFRRFVRFLFSIEDECHRPANDSEVQGFATLG